MDAETIARGLSGRKAGDEWVACCPSHDDRTPSLSLRDADDGKVLAHCHAGCSQGQVIAALRARGLWADIARRPSRRLARGIAVKREPNLIDTKRNEAAAQTLWRNTVPAVGSPVETYLRSRGLTASLPPAIRFHARLKHPSGTHWPAMVALVTRGGGGAPIAIHRTFLAHDGSGKAPVDPAKMMLGPCRGGVVRLADPGAVLMVGEGIETVLSAMQATGNAA